MAKTKDGKTYAGVSDTAVKKATGKSWAQWFALIDKAGGKKKTHREIAQLLYRRKDISDWWSQMVTVGYDYGRKGRKLGQTAHAGYQIGVTMTMNVSPAKAWDFMTSPKGLTLWIGNVGRAKLTKGKSFRAKNGTTGEIRTRGSRTKGARHMRLTWQPKAWKTPSTLQMRVEPRKTTRGTCISFHQEKLAGKKERAQMKKHWKRVLEKIEQTII